MAPEIRQLNSRTVEQSNDSDRLLSPALLSPDLCCLTAEAGPKTKLAAEPAEARLRSHGDERGITLALCMIVRDEADNLRDCIGPVSGCFDEIIVVDTGSTDETAEIARELGARVIDRPWEDDFAAARNASIGAALCDWILYLDADDRLAPVQVGELKKLLDSDGATAWQLRLASGSISRLPICEQAPTEQQTGEQVTGDNPNHSTVQLFNCSPVTSWQVRLFPNRPGVRFTGRVHEQIADSLRALGIEIKHADVTIEHVGSCDRDRLCRTAERNHRLLELQLAESPDDLATLFYLGRSHAEAGRFKHAIAALSHLVYQSDCRELEPEIFQYGFLNLAEVLQAAGRLTDARGKFDEVISLFPEFGLAHLERGECLLALAGQHFCLPLNQQLSACPLLDAAEDDFQRALELGIAPTDLTLNLDGLISAIHTGLGQCRRLRDDLAGAEAAYRRAIDACPDDLAAKLLLGNVLCDLGRHDEAEHCYDECIELHPDCLEAQYNLADNLERAGRFEDAAEAFARAVDLRPDLADAHLRLGHLYFRRDEFARAARSFRRARHADPSRAEPLLGCATAQLALDHPWQAMQAAKLAMLLPEISDELRKHAEMISTEADDKVRGGLTGQLIHKQACPPEDQEKGEQVTVDNLNLSTVQLFHPSPVRPRRARKPAPRRSISLCVINGDDAERLARCIRPVAGRVDEIVVVDTTVDAEIERLCRELDARYVPFEWADDFAAARNEAIAQASGDWLLWLDTDEQIAPEELEKVRKLVAGEPAAWKILSVSSDDGTPAAGRGQADRIRLIPNIPGLRFSGIAAERLDASLKECLLPVLESDVTITHVPDGERKHRELITRLLRERIQAAPDDCLAAAQAAGELRAQGQIAAAIETGVNVLQRTPLTAPDRRAALRQLSACVEMLPVGTFPPAGVRILLAEHYCVGGRIGEARWLLEALLEAPGGVEPSAVHYWLARCGFAQGAMNAVLEQLENIGDGSPWAADAACLAGIACEDVGRATAFLKKAVEIDPSMGPAHGALGDIYGLKPDDSPACRTGRDAAELHCRKAIACDAGDVGAHINLGTVLLRAGQAEAAERHFTIAARLAPSNAGALNNLGGLRFVRNRFEEAAELFGRAVKLDPTNAMLHQNLGAALFKLARYEESISSYTASLNLAPSHSDLLLALAEVHSARKDYGCALEMSEEFVRRAPFSARGFVKIAECYEAMDQQAAALASYKCAARLDPDLKQAVESVERLRNDIVRNEDFGTVE